MYVPGGMKNYAKINRIFHNMKRNIKIDRKFPTICIIETIGR